MTFHRTLLAAILAGAALAPAPAAVASCHACILGCDSACTPVYDALAAVESRASWDAYDTACHVVVDTTHLTMHCHD